MKTRRSLLHAEIRRLRMRRLLAAASIRLWAFTARHGVLPFSRRRWRARVMGGGGRRIGRPRTGRPGGPLTQPSVTASGQLLLPGIADPHRWA